MNEITHSKGPFAVGQYQPSPAFKAIESHSCVTDAATGMLICLTGPADCRQSQVDADLFSAAPDLYASVAELLKFVDIFRRLSGGEGDIAAMNARAALKKADGGRE